MKTAIATASYAGDFERCKLLCETLDAHVTGFTKHYLLVESGDVGLFRQLENAHRVVVDERDLLPAWLKAWPDPLTRGRRRIWFSPRILPLRGWHVQQMRRIALAAHIDDDAIFYADSDVAFLRSFDVGTLWRGEDLRLLRHEDALLRPVPGDQLMWSANAGALLGIDPARKSPHDYIGTLIAWRRDALISMCKRIEAVHHSHWVEVMGRVRRFSECMIYGRYADEILDGRGHFHDGKDLCRVFWFAPAPTDEEFRAFVAEMKPEQVAIGMQSFIGVDTDHIRRLIGC
ncbi:hypothetical protein ATN84_02380 [Paramesorhizobium deserti]|uniref:Glycosyl transferase n=1 Tax=Paramesorhizobium deserti TaxID=1494590 RepID=A0A135HZM5_9HYPH|nr:DUF6492 family protein [Paramesorhizobium deserti]KXF78652.1 hypothetical protein ATN84_02380 [Paramesorhizobium deserti]